jgi:hypothetical protein
MLTLMFAVERSKCCLIVHIPTPEGEIIRRLRRERAKGQSSEEEKKEAVLPFFQLNRHIDAT